MINIRPVYTTLLGSAMMLAASACSDDKTNIGIGSGTLDVTVEVNGDFRIAGDFTIPESVIRVPEPTDFDLVITDQNGTSASWTGVSESGVPERLLPGIYSLKAIYGSEGAEGFGKPCFTGVAAAQVINGMTTPTYVETTIANAMVDVVYDSTITSHFDFAEATLHSVTGAYCKYGVADSGPLFLRPGNISLYLSASYGNDIVTFGLITLPDARPATYYRVTLEAATSDNGIVSVTASTSDGLHNTVHLTTEFLAESNPVIETSGFTSGSTIIIPEGGSAPEPLRAYVSSASLSQLIFTGMAPTLGSVFTSELDLLHLSPVETDSLARYGISIQGLHPGSVDRGMVDLTHLISHLRYVKGAIPSTFSLLAVDASGRVSQPVTLSVDVSPVNLSIQSVSKAIIGVDKAQLIIQSQSPIFSENLSIQAFDHLTAEWIDMPTDTIEAAGPGLWAVTFDVPGGLDNVDCRLIYCDQEHTTFTVGRAAPSYAIEIDPFALHAVVKILADDPSTTGVITSSIRFFNKGKGSGIKGLEPLQMVERYPAQGLVKISGLDPSTSYALYSSLLSNPTSLDEDFSAPVTFKTEEAQQLPNPDFEDVKFSSIKYANMLSGGRYSQNTVEIYNLQNRTSFDLMTPTAWANVNDKTFCLDASNHNTWYMAPSTYTVEDAYSGAYAVRLDCVGYDLDGPEIPDYLQTSLPFTPYSLNIPQGFARAAGRLFLGSYSFDASVPDEHYAEGIAFGSRPATVNGFYKFAATSANPRATALARVEVLGDLEGVPVVIASGEAHLPVALSYTAFTIPLSYESFGMKASSIRILFSPSESIGDLGSETQSIIVISDPATSTSRGSSLWLDNLSLSY